MPQHVAPMIHVSDVRATVEWYERLGFRVLETFGDGGDGLSFGIVTFGDSRVMFNQGGAASDAPRREVDLYVYADDLEQHHERIRALIPITQPLSDTDYGMREFGVRDLNGFWITFGRDL